jgi:hypothetical protein
MGRIAAFLIGLLAMLMVAPATARTDEAPIRATVDGWYAELVKREAGRPERYTAPGFIDASPYYAYRNTGSAAAGPSIYTSLAARALRFRYDIETVEADRRFAKVRVWERGYFYAWAAQKTYESAAATLFVLEKQKDGRWLILAHQSSSIGIPPNKITNPMPDLRGLFYATEGKDRDPAKDAEEARRF